MGNADVSVLQWIIVGARGAGVLMQGGTRLGAFHLGTRYTVQENRLIMEYIPK